MTAQQPNTPTYEELLAQREALHSRCENLKEENARIWQQLLELKRHLFGRRSEKLIVDQRQELLSPSINLPAVEDEPEIEVPSHTRKTQGGRKPLPKDLPRERIEYEPEERSCPCCGEEMGKFDEEITEELDYMPARFLIREHVKIKRSCSRCEQGVRTGVLPPEAQVVERGRPGAGLLAQSL